MTRVNTAIAKLTKSFPEITGIRKDTNDSIHLGNAGEGGLINNHYAAEYYSGYINEILDFKLESMGFYPEFIDAGTLIAYRI